MVLELVREEGDESCSLYAKFNGYVNNERLGWKIPNLLVECWNGTLFRKLLKSYVSSYEDSMKAMACSLS